MNRKALIGLAASAALVGSSTLYAEGGAPDRSPPIMTGLEKAGLAKMLKDLNINIFGHAAASYTYNFDDPASEINPGRVFDVEHNELVFNQLDLTVERTVDAKKFDVGGRVEWIYGGDARFIHSNGLFDHHLDDAGAPLNPENQWDLNQLYGDVNIPVGNGLKVRFGKFVTLLGQEVINPTGNKLYSHSYLFGFAIPFTHTGVMATYALSGNWTVEGGVFRGWEQWEDNNNAVSFHVKGAYTSDDGKFGAIVNFVTGPEQPDDESNYRSVIDVIVTLKLSDQLSVAVNGDFGWEADVPGIGDSQWYGVAGYVTYVLSRTFEFNGRAEWFRDDDGSRTGIAADFYEITLGVTIKPLANDALGQNLMIRPEIRFDGCSEDVFDGGSSGTQFTAGVDVILLL